MYSQILAFILLSNCINYNSAKYTYIDDGALNDLLIDLDVGDENKDNYQNPNDMLAPPKIPSTAKKKESFLLKDIEEEEDSCHYENAKLTKCKEVLIEVSSHLEKLEHELTNEKKKTSILSSKVLDKKNIDIKEFYKRILHRFWLLLDLETTGLYLKGDNDALTFNLIVKVTQRDIDAFEGFFEGEPTQNQIDSFFSENFYTTEEEEEQVSELLTRMTNELYYHFRSFDFWLNLFWLLLFIVCIWFFYLYVADIQRERNWMKVIIIILVLAFIISFIHQWRYMIKVQEAKRNSMMAEMNMHHFEKTTCLEDNSFWFQIKSTLFGTRSKCEEYHEKMMIPPNEEISVGMAMMDTLTSLVLLPLKKGGLHMGLFFTNFFTNIPWMFQLPSVIIFVSLFTLIIFAVFGYGIHFPLWMGSIKQERPQIDSSENLRKLIKESEERVERINLAMIREAKDMLTKVSEIAIAQAQAQSSSSTMLVEPIVQKCTVIIEKKLEDLINKKIVDVVEYPATSQVACRSSPSELEDEVDKNVCDKLTGQSVKSLRLVKRARETNENRSPENSGTVVACNDDMASISPHELNTVSNETDNDFMIKLKRIFEEHEH